MARVHFGNEDSARRTAAAVQRVEAMPTQQLAPPSPSADHSPLPFFVGVVSSTNGIAPLDKGTVTPWNYIAASSAFLPTSKADETVHDWFMTGADFGDRVMYWRHRLSGKLVFLRTTYVLQPGSST